MTSPYNTLTDAEERLHQHLMQNYNNAGGEHGERAELERALLEAVDGERAWFARTLHGGACQSLHGMGFLCRVLEARLKESGAAALPEMADLQAAIRRAGNEIREVVLWSRDGASGEAGLVASLAGLAEGISERVPCEFHCKTAISIAEGFVREQLIHIAHEAARIALCSAWVSRIEISLQSHGHEIMLSVRHDGDASEQGKIAAPETAWELLRMRARAIEATLATIPSPGKGATITCRLPIPS